ncbi:oxidative damage protection protein [Enterobacteriaceae bacterium ET-AT1-13]|nr:oxidative damage protection protein [Enterobacteriaceae bacterium ET-AT1-13]WGS66395.1 oxidative damage protection protein [Enterobacteriaceae bacterium Cmel17]WMC17421.1 MAG: oxidative damage protection protein [Enterobacteriaceae bacterium Cmel21]WMC17627.1 MAG: oxidative damage protection protein [Enterobacteriaceae bacterium PSmelAO3-2]WMC17832.1 MAG: oxidative damage protection protein [Enterobacteriaceae bacterium PSmelAO3-1]WMC18035.1 MAG: oxidative damage protection protein [Enterob
MEKIFCFYFKKMENSNLRIYPGKLGNKIFTKISKKAWIEWLKVQTILINENNLNMSNDEDIKKIECKMINFLFKK